MRAARLTAGLIITAASLTAAEEMPGKKASSESEDVIAAAKRDLETIKAVRGAAAEAQRVEGPHFAVPEMQLGTGASPRAGAQAGIPKTKSPNWLLDAMAKKSDGKQGDSSKSIERESENTVRDSVETLGGDDKAKRESAADHERRDQTAGAGARANPLAAYMAGWMTPQDYKLLKPTMGPTDAAMTSGVTEAAGQNLFSVGSGEPRRGADRSFDGKPGRTPDNTPRENPFLQALAAPVPTASRLNVPTGQAPTPTPATTKSTASTPTSPPLTLQTVTPSFVKPQDDTKYFKPLKKF